MTQADAMGALPELVLPPPIEVRPPKYSYEQYEQEERSWRKGKRKWQDEQRRRWREGHEGLTGIHYFYLTQLKIKDSGGQMIRPNWRDVDERNIEEYIDCENNELDLNVFKRREFGLSTLYAGVIPIYKIVTNAGCTCLMTSADLGRLGDLINNKFIAQINSLEEWVGIKIKKYDSKLGVIEIRHFDEDGNEIKGTISTMLCRQTSQNKKDVGNFEGARAIYGFLDELFLHPHPKEVRMQTESCFMKGFKRVGIMVCGGSSGLNNPLGLKEANTIRRDAERGLVRLLFIRGTEGIGDVTIKDTNGKKIGEENFCINGWSDSERAEAYIRWQLEILDRSPDKKDYISFKKRYPLDISDVLISDKEGVIPEEIAKMIPEQLLFIERNIPNIRRMKIVWDGEVPSLVEHSSGPFHMLKRPVKQHRYGMGSDPTPFFETNSESVEIETANGSMFCAVIKDFDENEYVGVYLKRTQMPASVYMDIKGLQIIFDCKNMIERNRGDAFYQQYADDNNLEMLAYQPVWVGAKGYKRNTLRGWYKAANAAKAYDATFEFFKAHMHKVMFEMILTQLQSFGPDTNCDIIDAIVSCEVYHKGLEKTAGEIAAMMMNEKQVEIPIVYISGGQRKIRYEKRSEKGMNQFGNGHNIF